MKIKFKTVNNSSSGQQQSTIAMPATKFMAANRHAHVSLMNACDICANVPTARAAATATTTTMPIATRKKELNHKKLARSCNKMQLTQRTI